MFIFEDLSMRIFNIVCTVYCVGVLSGLNLLIFTIYNVVVLVQMYLHRTINAAI